MTQLDCLALWISEIAIKRKLKEFVGQEKSDYVKYMVILTFLSFLSDIRSQ